MITPEEVKLIKKAMTVFQFPFEWDDVILVMRYEEVNNYGCFYTFDVYSKDSEIDSYLVEIITSIISGRQLGVEVAKLNSISLEERNNG